MNLLTVRPGPSREGVPASFSEISSAAIIRSKEIRLLDARSCGAHPAPVEDDADAEYWTEEGFRARHLIPADVAERNDLVADPDVGEGGLYLTPEGPVYLGAWSRIPRRASGVELEVVTLMTVVTALECSEVDSDGVARGDFWDCS